MRSDSLRRRLALGLVALALTACAETRPAPPPKGAFVDCVPYARAATGVALHGDAWTWWDRAANRYERGHRPVAGAILAWQRTRSLPLGHVAVVVAVQSPRKILVSHANWGGDGETRGKVHERQPAIDVSPRNDWSEVRLENTLGRFGRMYPTHGFIYPRSLEQASTPGG